MADVVIRAEGLGKRYVIGHESREEGHVALRDAIARSTRRFLRKAGDMVQGRPVVEGDDLEEVWALREVGFEITRGEVVGIVGRNGAGKSTLLKILSRITEPTTGKVEIRGRVASLLEVGTGFHGELSGRENIYLNGAILGMTRQEIRRKFDEIVAFAEVERYLDTPVKRYSSGMYVRLAFAVAAHLEPEILIVDEVLAVGDLAFQQKCLGKMRDVAGRQGRTVLFVSHNLAAIQALCDSGIYLRNGTPSAGRDIDVLLAQYVRDLRIGAETHEAGSVQLSEEIVLEHFEIGPNPVQSGSELRFALEFSATVPTRLRELCILFYTATGTRIGIVDLRSTTLDYDFGTVRRLKIAGTIANFCVIEGEYSVGIYINCGQLKRDFYDLLTLTVVPAAVAHDVVPYPAHDRGVVELKYAFSAT